MPELQGRFPIRVELTDLTQGRFHPHPDRAEERAHQAIQGPPGHRGVELDFTPDAVDALADYAFQVNQSTQNIGARRLYTIMERLLEELSFEAPDMGAAVEIDAAYVKQQLDEVTEDEDLSKFIL